LSREQYGSNELAPQKVENFWDKLKGNFKDPIIIILCVALVIIFILSVFEYTEWYEAVSIASAVLLSVLVSTLSEFKNEQSFQKLQEEASRIKSRIFRDNDLVELVVSEVVVGDYILLQAGDKVPADGQLVSGDLKVNQASLTGESENVHKIPAPENYRAKENDFSDKYLLFKGSVIDEGEGVMKVDKVGDDTFYGQLAQELSIGEERLSPLQVKLADLAKMISRFGKVIKQAWLFAMAGGLIFIMGILLIPIPVAHPFLLLLSLILTSIAFAAAGLRCFGPTRAAAQLEGSKVFTKDFLFRHRISPNLNTTPQNHRLIFTRRSLKGLNLICPNLATSSRKLIAGMSQTTSDPLHLNLPSTKPKPHARCPPRKGGAASTARSSPLPPRPATSRVVCTSAPWRKPKPRARCRRRR